MSASSPAAPAESEAGELRRRLHAFVARRVDDPAAADDLAQEIMLRLHAAGERLRDESRLEAYAYRIARNVIVDHWRGRGSERPVGSGVDAARAGLDDGPTDEDALREVLGRWLVARIEALPARDRELLRRVELQGEEQGAVAEAVGLPYSTVKSRVQRARARLHAELIACCRVELDARGRVTDFEPRAGPCDCEPSGCGPSSS